MKIIEQSHEIISLPKNLLQTIEKAGRTCYKSEDRITNISANEFTEMLIRRNHHAMIEFGDIIVKFITNRGITHELVRHRLCSFAQESTRYVKYNDEMVFIRPIWLSLDKDSSARDSWTSAMLHTEKIYKDLINNNWKAEQAREVLPNALKTEIVVKTNIREWRHIFSLRCSASAHPQMRALMIPLLNELKEKVPIVFDDI